MLEFVRFVQDFGYPQQNDIPVEVRNKLPSDFVIFELRLPSEHGGDEIAKILDFLFEGHFEGEGAAVCFHLQICERDCE